MNVPCGTLRASGRGMSKHMPFDPAPLLALAPGAPVARVDASGALVEVQRVVCRRGKTLETSGRAPTCYERWSMVTGKPLQELDRTHRLRPATEEDIALHEANKALTAATKDDARAADRAAYAVGLARRLRIELVTAEGMEAAALRERAVTLAALNDATKRRAVALAAFNAARHLSAGTAGAMHEHKETP